MTHGLHLVLGALATLGALTTVAAIYKLAAPTYHALRSLPSTIYHLERPTNVLLTASKLETNGTATVAVATRRLYRCVSYASLLPTYNGLNFTPDCPVSKLPPLTYGVYSNCPNMYRPGGLSSRYPSRIY